MSSVIPVVYTVLKKDDYLVLEEFINSIKFDRIQESQGWKRALESLMLGDNRYFVSAEIVNNKITSAALSYSIDSIWKSDRHLLPYWAIGAYRNINSTTPVRERTENLLGPIVNYFESIGYYSYFMSRMVSAHLTFGNVDKVFSRMASFGFSITRYDCKIETIFDEKLDWNTLPSLYKAVSFNSCPPGKRVAILRYDLKSEFRK